MEWHEASISGLINGELRLFHPEISGGSYVPVRKTCRGPLWNQGAVFVMHAEKENTHEQKSKKFKWMQVFFPLFSNNILTWAWRKRQWKRGRRKNHPMGSMGLVYLAIFSWCFVVGMDNSKSFLANGKPQNQTQRQYFNKGFRYLIWRYCTL